MRSAWTGSAKAASSTKAWRRGWRIEACGIAWIFLSVVASRIADSNLFASAGALGLISMAAFSWMQRSILARYEAQISSNRMHSIAHMHVQGLAKPDEMESAADVAKESSWYASWLARAGERLAIAEAVVGVIATLQWAFGARILNRLLICGEWQCSS
jgi:hypothetical protein